MISHPHVSTLCLIASLYIALIPDLNLRLARDKLIAVTGFAVGLASLAANQPPRP